MKNKKISDKTYSLLLGNKNGAKENGEKKMYRLIEIIIEEVSRESAVSQIWIESLASALEEMLNDMREISIYMQYQEVTTGEVNRLRWLCARRVEQIFRIIDLEDPNWGGEWVDCWLRAIRIYLEEGNPVPSLNWWALNRGWGLEIELLVIEYLDESVRQQSLEDGEVSI